MVKQIRGMGPVPNEGRYCSSEQAILGEASREPPLYSSFLTRLTFDDSSLEEYGWLDQFGYRAVALAVDG